MKRIKYRETPVVQKKRLAFFFAFLVLGMAVLTFRLGWYQIIRREYFYDLALDQQTSDATVTASRGTIYDANGKTLAVSSVTYTIWARPGYVATGKTDEAKAERLTKTVKGLSEILGIDEETVRATLTAEKALIRVAKYVPRDAAEEVRKNAFPGISLQEDSTRTYPMGAFAAHLIGGTTDDNVGLSGLELQYNSVLSGTSGRKIITTDAGQRALAVSDTKVYEAQDGLSVVTTIDEVIQHYTEQAIEQVCLDTEAKRVMAIVTDPMTNAIYAMATYPEFDPNDPRTPLDEAEAAVVASLPNEEKMEYWNRMWRNPLVSDTYEPGSTFKLVTTSIALEEGLSYVGEVFRCTGYHTVAGTTQVLKCWRYYNPHGLETLSDAVKNSCNPVFMQIAERIGKERFYEYLNLFNINGRTGIDFPGEAYNLIQPKATSGPVELATMSYGQGIAVTPISLVTAVGAMVNGGYLMEPHLVKELVNADGETVETFEPTVTRRILSAKTCEELKGVMENAAENSTASVPGYRIGGKSGTADKAEDGEYRGNTCSSFLAVAPIDDPKLLVLVIVDSPQGVKFGSTTAGPGVKYILENCLRYLNIEPHYTAAELAAMKTNKVTVPNVTGEAYEDAAGILAGLELDFAVTPETDTDEFTVVNQYPAPGTEAEKGSLVYLYSR
ncbi:MAG: PASTA domain-containing protein [Firmicutes bacterium]|nr:PASTA domain-containing protein [Bacillota bacterium]